MTPELYDLIHHLVFTLVPDKFVIDLRMLGAWALILGGLYGWHRCNRRHD